MLPAETAARVGYDVRGGRLGQPPGQGAAAGRRRPAPRSPAPARSCVERSGSGPALRAGPLDAVGPGVVHRPGRHRHGRHPPALGADLATDPADNTVAVLGRDVGEGLRDGAGDERVVRPALGAGDVRRRPPAVGRRLRDLRAAVARRRPTTGSTSPPRSGTGLFDFGHRDGPADQALLQHPLGVAVLPDGSVAVSDTYNGAIRRFDPATGEVSTLAGRPARAQRRGRRARRRTRPAGRRGVRGPPARRGCRCPTRHQRVDGLRPRRPSGRRTEVAPGPRRADGRVQPAHRPEARRPLGRPDPAGRVGDARRSCCATGAGSAAGADPHADPRPARAGDGVLHVSVQAAACDGDPVDRRGARTRRLPPVPAGLGHPRDRLVHGADRVAALDLRGLSRAPCVQRPGSPHRGAGPSGSRSL